VHAFVDENGNSVADPGEPNLSDYIVECLGADARGLTDGNGVVFFDVSPGQVTGAIVGPARIVPAALTHTSQLDTDQAALLPVLDPNSAPQCEGVFAGLFFDCWYPEVTNAHDLYTRMLESAHEVSPDFYNRINRIFWDNNMVIPHVASTDSVYRLADALSRPVAGTFPARVIQSANLLDMTGGTNDLIGPTTATDTLNTNANGEIPADSLDIDPNTMVLVVDINIRSLMPRADAAGFDVWVRGRFPALH
jgi:hypothetical protein